MVRQGPAQPSTVREAGGALALEQVRVPGAPPGVELHSSAEPQLPRHPVGIMRPHRAVSPEHQRGPFLWPETAAFIAQQKRPGPPSTHPGHTHLALTQAYPVHRSRMPSTFVEPWAQGPAWQWLGVV